MGIYDKDLERLANAKIIAKMIIKELNKKKLFTCGDCEYFKETDVIGGLGYCRAVKAGGVSIHPKNEACKYIKLLTEKKESKLPETCICKCGCGLWEIYPRYIKCIKCEKEYNFPGIIQKPVFIDVSKFNQERKMEG